MSINESDAARLRALKARIVEQERLLAEGKGDPAQQRIYDSMKSEVELLVHLIRVANKRAKEGKN